MFSGKSIVRKRPDLRVVPCLNLFHLFEKPPLSQPLPEASHDEEKVEDVNLAELWKHISELLKPREKGNSTDVPSFREFRWPNVPALQDLKGIVLLASDHPITDIHEDVKAILGRVNVATVAPLVVAHTLERLKDIFTNRQSNRQSFGHLVKEMYDLAIVLKRLSESPEGTQDLMQEATLLIIEGARLFSILCGRNGFAFEELVIREKLNTMQRHIKRHPAIEHHRRSHLWKEYPTHADNGQVEEDLLSTGRHKGFKIGALVAATNNFHEDNKVGEGGYGAVYKGTTHDGKQIAVKKMSFTDKRSRAFMKKQFENEKLLAGFQHRNLVNLLGYCEQRSEGFLVYEYLPNESLDKFLSDPEKRKHLDWYKRYNIIDGIVCGLCYLHEYSQLRIVHRDIKASNILLDEKLNPKIADFGTAKLFPEDRTHVTATTRVGTRGYMPPEYAMDGKITVKVDVYSFGVVLFELLTGKLILNNGAEYLEWVWSSYNQNKVADIIDRTITETWDKEKGKAKAKAKAKALALRCFQVALLCIQNDAKLRPTMLEVKMKLSSSESLPVPTKPPLVSSPRRSCF